MKISNYINIENTRLVLNTGIGYLCGSIISLVTHSTHPTLWKVAGIIAPIAHFALENGIKRFGKHREMPTYKIDLLKDVLKTVELGIATIVLAAIKFNAPVMTACFLGLTILSGYEARQKFNEQGSQKAPKEDGQELKDLAAQGSKDEPEL